MAQLNTISDVAAVCLADSGMPTDPLLPIISPRVIKRKHRAKNCPYTKEFLEDLYINKRMTRKQICTQLGVSTGSLHSWFTGLDIRLPQHLYAEATGGQDREKVMIGKRLLTALQRANSHKNTHKMYEYNMIFNPAHPSCNQDGYILEHRQVIESQIHRFLKSYEDVHHINFIRGDNRKTNLMLLNENDHKALHWFMGNCGAYALGLVDEMPEPLKLKSPAFWNGEWLEEISVETFDRISKQNKQTVH